MGGVSENTISAQNIEDINAALVIAYSKSAFVMAALDDVNAVMLETNAALRLE